MNKTMMAVVGAVKKSTFGLRKHSPQILIVAGVIGTVTSAVMACRATLKVNDILEEKNRHMEIIDECRTNHADEYSEEDAQKDVAIVYAKTAMNLVKLYGPSIALGTISIGSMVLSNHILHKRNVAIAAAYTAVSTSFKEYRDRVMKRFGKEVENEIRHNIRAEEIEKTVTDPDTGEVKTVKETIHVADIDGISEYARFFDDGCAGWEKDSEYNLMFLRAQQQYANDLLRANGYLYLNEVYDMLGIPRSKAGQVVGWVYNPDDPNYKGDSYVDFGIYDTNREKCRDFVNGYERTILLDFNVDGNIWDLMK